MTESMIQRLSSWRNRLLQWQILVGITVIAGASLVGLLVVHVIVPGYKETSSRLYTTPLGYPVLLRLLGEPIPVVVARSKWDALPETVLARGQIDADKKAQVATTLTEAVLAVHVNHGSRVRKGDLLVELRPDAIIQQIQEAAADVRGKRSGLKAIQEGFRPEAVTQAQVTLETKKAELDSALVKLKREEVLFEKGVSAKVALEEARVAYETARNDYLSQLEQVAISKQGRAEDINSAEAALDKAIATLRLRQLDLQATRILAPISGIVIDRLINPGEMTNGPQHSLLTIVDQVTFRAEVDQRQTGKVEIGKEAQVFLDIYPRQRFGGTVAKINPAIQTALLQLQGKATAMVQQSSGLPTTFPVWVTLSETDLSIVPGLTGFARMEISSRSLVIPPNAIFHVSGGEGLVFVVEDLGPRARPIVFGITSKGKTQVLDGLREGERVIISGNESLREGDHIQITREE